jgi:hypothetical protein
VAVRGFIDGVIALPFALLPKRYWQSFDLPVANVAVASAFIILFLGFGLGIPGYFFYLARMQSAPGMSMLEVGKLQVEGKLPETAEVAFTPVGIYATAPIAFLFFTPLGLLCTYLVLSSWFRLAAAYVDETHGDPILTLVDSTYRRVFSKQQARNVRVAREKLEGVEEPDRRYDGAWAGLKDVEFVIVSARRKPGWTKGTWVITPDGWYVLGEPFDRPMPNGLRTVYPLTLQNTLEAVRKSVQYELPPLRATKVTNESVKKA